MCAQSANLACAFNSLAISSIGLSRMMGFMAGLNFASTVTINLSRSKDSKLYEVGGMILLLYTTAGCHLCEQAGALLDVLKTQHQVSVEAVEISVSEELVEQYGIRIPVVKNKDTEEELGWPFTYEELVSLI